MELKDWQKERLWRLICTVSQGPALFEEDHEYDEDRKKVIAYIQTVLTKPEYLGGNQ